MRTPGCQRPVAILGPEPKCDVGAFERQPEERARGVLERDLDVCDQSVTSRWLASGRC